MSNSKQTAGVPPQGTLVLMLPGLPRQAALKKFDGRWTKDTERAAKRMARTPECVKIPAPVMQKLWKKTGGWSTAWVARPTGPWAHSEITELKVTADLSVMLNRDGAYMRWRGRFVAVNWKPHWSSWRRVMEQLGSKYDATNDLQNLRLIEPQPTVSQAEDKTIIVVTDGEPPNLKALLKRWQQLVVNSGGKGVGQLMLHSPPGTGKSDFVNFFANGAKSGAAGMEYANAFFDSSGSMVFGHSAHDIVAHETSHGGAINESWSDSILLIDEINRCPPLTPERQAAMDEFLNDATWKRPFGDPKE